MSTIGKVKMQQLFAFIIYKKMNLFYRSKEKYKSISQLVTFKIPLL